MKIAVICPYALSSVGGVQAHALELSRKLRAKGHEAFVVGPGNEPSRRDFIIRVPVNRSVAPISLSPGLSRRALEAIAGADVVHIHEPFVPLVSLTALLEARPPKVGTFHAAPDWEIALVYRTGARLLRRLGCRLSAATAVSSVAASAAASIVRSVRIVPLAIEVDLYAPSLPRHPERVIFLGRDEPRKGLSVLLSAWPHVKKRRPEAELVVVGSTRSEKLPGVRYLGIVDEAAKRAELAQASILCAPNLGQESFGVILLEAMASGCAVVASRLPAFAEVLGGAALLVPPGDASALAASLSQLLSDGQRRRALERAGRERARQYDWEKVLPQYLEIYRQATAGTAERASA